MTHKGNIVGIDPDVEKSGVAWLIRSSRALIVKSLAFGDLIDFLKSVKETSGDDVLVCVEAGYLNRSNWHTSLYGSHARTAEIGRSVGRNHEAAHKIVEVSRWLGLSTIEVHPLRKVWRKGKISSEELAALTGYAGRTNQDGRDAALIAWEVAQLPMKLNFN